MVVREGVNRETGWTVLFSFLVKRPLLTRMERRRADIFYRRGTDPLDLRSIPSLFLKTEWPCWAGAGAGANLCLPVCQSRVKIRSRYLERYKFFY